MSATVRAQRGRRPRAQRRNGATCGANSTCSAALSPWRARWNSTWNDWRVIGADIRISGRDSGVTRMTRLRRARHPRRAWLPARSRGTGCTEPTGTEEVAPSWCSPPRSASCGTGHSPGPPRTATRDGGPAVIGETNVTPRPNAGGSSSGVASTARRTVYGRGELYRQVGEARRPTRKEHVANHHQGDRRTGHPPRADS